MLPDTKRRGQVEKSVQSRSRLCGVRCRIVGGNRFTYEARFGVGGEGAHRSRVFLRQNYVNGDAAMRVVVVKSPRFLGGILRKLFGIAKEEYID